MITSQRTVEKFRYLKMPTTGEFSTKKRRDWLDYWANRVKTYMLLEAFGRESFVGYWLSNRQGPSLRRCVRKVRTNWNLHRNFVLFSSMEHARVVVHREGGELVPLPMSCDVAAKTAGPIHIILTDSIELHKIFGLDNDIHFRWAHVQEHISWRRHQHPIHFQVQLNSRWQQ